MTLKLLGTLVGMALFVAYFLPIAVKLREVSLALIIAGGIVLAAVDAWHTFSERDD
ncbi:MAG: hypothetical protein AB7P08_17860 [Burkholderiales bacterium]